MISTLRKTFWTRQRAKPATSIEEQRRQLEQERLLRARLDAFVRLPATAAEPASAGELAGD